MRRLEQALGAGAGLTLFLMMALTFLDVIGRKLVGQSVPGATESTEILMLLTIFLALPLASLKGEHVAFDLLDNLLPRALRRFQHLVSHGLCVAALLGAAWLVEGRAQRTVEEGDHTAQLGIALGPLHHLTAALLLITALVHIQLLLRGREERGHG